ncbi:hypothetical protein BDZ97DRAFT_1920010 [Flammula alnicola]|nr:hypothetical protein BDZ97DRAFT_1930850 [Flammula alnicola]KAF8963107.1 hypothetical protein BDZ97DRAFT_1920010 [Flammula alnicola]
MRALGLGVIIEVGLVSQFKVGDHVSGPWGMTEYAVMKDKTLDKIDLPPGVEPLDFLNVLGTSGLTAYFICYPPLLSVSITITYLSI